MKITDKNVRVIDIKNPSTTGKGGFEEEESTRRFFIS
jgi:hypothetical protein